MGTRKHLIKLEIAFWPSRKFGPADDISISKWLAIDCYSCIDCEYRPKARGDSTISEEIEIKSHLCHCLVRLLIPDALPTLYTCAPKWLFAFNSKIVTKLECFPNSLTLTAWSPSVVRKTFTGKKVYIIIFNNNVVLSLWFIYCSVFESELADTIPVIHTSVAGCRIIGRLTVGKKL